MIRTNPIKATSHTTSLILLFGVSLLSQNLDRWIPFRQEWLHLCDESHPETAKPLRLDPAIKNDGLLTADVRKVLLSKYMSYLSIYV